MAQKPKFNEQIHHALDSPLSATQLSLIPVSFRHTLPSVPPSFQELLCKGAHTSIWDDWD